MINDVEKMTDSEILESLHQIGITTTIQEFKKTALETGSPSTLVEQWLSLHEVDSIDEEEFLYEAAIELWKRHLKDVRNPEVVRESINNIIFFYEDKKDHNRESILKVYEGIKNFYHYCLNEDGIPDPEFYQQVVEESVYDIESFLINLPAELTKHGLIDEALNIDKWFVNLSSQPKEFYIDMGYILANAGRKEEALKQIEENLNKFPNDFWIIINAGDVLFALGDDRAEEYFLKGYEMAGEDKHNRASAIERLVNFYKRKGDESKVKKFKSEYEILTNPDSEDNKKVK